MSMEIEIGVSRPIVKNAELPPEELERKWVTPRNGRGQPMIWLPDGSKRKAYARPSGLGDALEDKEGLMKWGERVVLDGLSRDRSLLDSYGEILRKYESGEMDAKQWRAATQGLTEKAKDLAHANLKRDMGTVLHEITEAIDKGRDPGWIPPDIEPLIAAYNAAMDWGRREMGMEVLDSEVFVVNDDWEVAGSLDKLLRWQDSVIIGDSKTSGTLNYAKGKFCIQIGCYARGVRYDPAAALRDSESAGVKHDVGRSPLSSIDVRQDMGIIIHFPSESSECSLVEVNLTPAERGYMLQKDVREWRNFWNRKAQATNPLVTFDGMKL